MKKFKKISNGEEVEARKLTQSEIINEDLQIKYNDSLLWEITELSGDKYILNEIEFKQRFQSIDKHLLLG
jgi:hypothetical protein